MPTLPSFLSRSLESAYKRPALAISIGSGLAVATSLIAQYGFGYDPCPLCLTQRLLFMAIFLLSTTALALKKFETPSTYLLFLASAFSCAGILIVGYHFLIVTQTLSGGCSITFPLFIGQVQELLPESLIFLMDGYGSCSPELYSAEFYETLVFLVGALGLFALIEWVIMNRLRACLTR